MQVVTVAKFQGGGAFNVIPDSVTIGGTFRAFLKDSMIQLKQRIEEVYKFELLSEHFSLSTSACSFPPKIFSIRYSIFEN